MRILVVEDEIELCEAIVEGLELDGYAVDMTHDGEEAYELLVVENYDLAILDLNLPNMDGIEILQKVREENNDVKILILSARGSISERVQGLELGANDYLVKPFAFEELEIRVKNLLRRRFVQDRAVIQIHRLVVNTNKREVLIDGNEIILTKKEFGILEYLALHRDRVVSKEELIEHVWNNEVDSFSNAIRVHITTLRKKLIRELGFDIIQTKIGEGYYLEESKNENI